jgi:hypothetical protein
MLGINRGDKKSLGSRDPADAAGSHVLVSVLVYHRAVALHLTWLMCLLVLYFHTHPATPFSRAVLKKFHLS